MENQKQSYIVECQRKDLSFHLFKRVERMHPKSHTASVLRFVFKKIAEEILESSFTLIEPLDSCRYEFVIDISSYALPKSLHRSFLAKLSYELIQFGLPDHVVCSYVFEEGYPIYLNVSFLINYGSLKP